MDDRNSRSTPSRRPGDGPATRFEPDVHLSKLPSTTDGTVGSEFGLVVVAAWPPDLASLGAGYGSFLNEVRRCFDSTDVDGIPAVDGSEGGGGAPVYLYPPQYLHVTVATLHAFTRPEPRDQQRRTKLATLWKEVALSASKRPEWPKRTLNLRISSAQIGKKAGILLWDETTGGLDAMRRCISDEVSARASYLQEMDVDSGTLSIPPIIHSTFLRFRRVPSSDGGAVQEKFQSLVLPRLADFFPDDVRSDCARLVCERTPYMHIPNDEAHVLVTLPLDR